MYDFMGTREYGVFFYYKDTRNQTFISFLPIKMKKAFLIVIFYCTLCMPISSFAHNSQDLLNKVRDDGLIALESSRNNNKLTAPMRDTLLHTLQLILTELKDRLDNIPTINFNNNLCNTNAHKGKVRYLADS